MKLLRELYLDKRFFYGLTVVIICFLISYWNEWLFYFAQLTFIVFLAVVILDGLFLFTISHPVSAVRRSKSQLSLGDSNLVSLEVSNEGKFPYLIEIVDELPVQMQERNFLRRFLLKPGDTHFEDYSMKPVKRGAYRFGNINLFLKSIIGFLNRRVVIPTDHVCKVMPSIVQMKKFELQVNSKTAAFHGIKKIRRLGMNNEFEQIRNYVQGDDYRAINWKATSRTNELKVNQYQDERSQQIYCVIDKSRVMRMPFNGMSLLDYAINSTLTIANIAMLKGDKAGLITYSDKLGSRLKAERSSAHLKRIMDVLYKQQTQFKEANYELLYYGLRQNIKGRSLILLFTNFESKYALERAMNLLRKINKTHLLVVVFFKDTELEAMNKMECHTVKDIYLKTLARKTNIEKEVLVRELAKYGIQALLTRPEELSVKTINKYLELKSRGMI